MSVAEIQMDKIGSETQLYYHHYGTTTGNSPVTLNNVIGNVKIIASFGTYTSGAYSGKTRSMVVSPDITLIKHDVSDVTIRTDDGFTQTGSTVSFSTRTSASVTFDNYYWSDAET